MFMRQMYHCGFNKAIGINTKKLILAVEVLKEVEKYCEWTAESNDSIQQEAALNKVAQFLKTL